jgi:hypothetical protein
MANMEGSRLRLTASQNQRFANLSHPLHLCNLRPESTLRLLLLSTRHSRHRPLRLPFQLV